VGELQGQLYFTMKLLEAGSLAAQPERFRADPRGAAGLVAGWPGRYITPISAACSIAT
jgi:hypothetical protein